MDAGNFRGSRRVAKNKMLKMCIFAKDGDFKNSNFKTLFSEAMTSKRCYKSYAEEAKYGKPNGAKFKKQNWSHVQQNCYQGQDRFQSSSTKFIHVQPIFSHSQDI